MELLVNEELDEERIPHDGELEGSAWSAEFGYF